MRQSVVNTGRREDIRPADGRHQMADALFPKARGFTRLTARGLSQPPGLAALGWQGSACNRLRLTGRLRACGPGSYEVSLRWRGTAPFRVPSNNAAAGGYNLQPRRGWPPSPLNSLNPPDLLPQPFYTTCLRQQATTHGEAVPLCALRAHLFHVKQWR